MAERYQSSFTGEEIDSLLQKVKNGTQPDYTQNDSTQPDYIKNRPFYTIEGYKYEWDGQATDESRKVGIGSSQFYYYKISDNVKAASDLIGATVTMSGTPLTISESSIKTYENNSFSYRYYTYELVFVCAKAGSYNTNAGTIELTPGLWFLNGGFYPTKLEKKALIKQIDNVYIAKATAIDDDNADLPVTAGLLKTELDNTITSIDEALSTAIGSGVLE